MAFNGSSGSGGSEGNGNSDGPHANKRLCTGQNSDINDGHTKTRNSNNNNSNNNNNISDEPRRKRHESARPNHILLFTIINPVYPITVEVLHTITHQHGQVMRVVIFKKNGVQAMIEFDSIDTATRVRDSLNGCDIYSGCCTLKIDYAKPEKLNVYKNDSDSSWDYTLAKDVGNGRSPLLQDPLFGSRPQPFKPALLGGGGSVNNGGNGSGSGGGGGGGGASGFSPFGAPPDFHQNNDSWKTNSTHSLMKDPPIGPGRNGPNNFATQAQSQGGVMMVYGLDSATSNTDKLFNLVCLYGNVARIKFLKTKEGTAMIQMGDAVAVERCVQHLNNIPVGNGNGRLQIAFSKQNFLSEVTNPYSLPDHSPSFKEYTGSKNNRFLSPAQASKNRIQPPSKILHFFNTPPALTDEQLLEIFNLKDVPPTTVKMFPLKSERSSSGLVEFPNVAQAVLAIMKCNHTAVESKGTKFPFIMKLCFSSTKNMNGNWANENDKVNCE